jgi:hypothetical protein
MGGLRNPERLSHLSSADGIESSVKFNDLRFIYVVGGNFSQCATENINAFCFLNEILYQGRLRERISAHRDIIHSFKGGEALLVACSINLKRLFIVL